MCGRYASSRSPEDIVEEFEVLDPRLDHVVPPSYNVAPTDEVYAVMERAKKDDDGNVVEEAVRQLRVLRWGLVPSWAKDEKIGSRMINARMETVAEKPAFRKAFAARRCILPADGYFEWYETRQRTAKGKPRKQPFFITPQDGSVLAMAGLYEIWRDPTKDREDDSAWLRTCTVITTSASDAVGHVHDRMPMVIAPEQWDAWLDPKLTDPEAARQLLAVTEPDLLEAYAVSTLVSNVKNNGPELLDPLTEEPPEGLF